MLERERLRKRLSPIPLCLLEDVLGIVFIEIVPFDWDRYFGLRIPVNVMVCSMPLEYEPKCFQFLDCLYPRIQAASPFLYLIIHNSVYFVNRKLCKNV